MQVGMNKWPKLFQSSLVLIYSPRSYFLLWRSFDSVCFAIIVPSSVYRLLNQLTGYGQCHRQAKQLWTSGRAWPLQQILYLCNTKHKPQLPHRVWLHYITTKLAGLACQHIYSEYAAHGLTWITGMMYGQASHRLAKQWSEHDLYLPTIPWVWNLGLDISVVIFDINGTVSVYGMPMQSGSVLLLDPLF